MVVVACPSCKKQLQVFESMAGQQAKCPHCKTTFLLSRTTLQPTQVPSQESLPDPSAPPAPIPPPPPPVRRPPPLPVSHQAPVEAPPALAPSRVEPRRRRRSGAKVAAVVFLALLLGTGVGGGIAWWLLRSGGPEGLRYLPDGCRVVQLSHTEAIEQSPAYQRLGKQRAIEPAVSLPPELAALIGLKPAEIRLVLAGQTGEADETILVVQTREPISATELLERNKSLTYRTEKVGRYAMHQRKELAFCVPEGGTVVLGSASQLRKVLARDGRPRLPAGMEAAFRQGDWSRGVVAAMDLTVDPPPGVADTGVQAIVAAFDWGEDLGIGFTFFCKDDEAAEKLKQQMEAAQGPRRQLEALAKRFGALQTLKSLAPVSEVEVASEGNRVTLSMTIPQDRLAKAGGQAPSDTTGALFSLLFAGRRPPAAPAEKPIAFWVEQMEEPEPFREEAIQRLTALEAKALPALREALGHANVGRRRGAADVAGRLGLKAGELAPELRKALKDDDALVRRRAAMALGKIGTTAKPAAYRDLIEALGDSDADVVTAARAALGQVGPPVEGDVPVLAALLRDRGKSAEVRTHAAVALGQVGPPARPGALADLLDTLTDPDAALRAAGGKALARLKPATADDLAVILPRLGDRTTPVHVRRLLLEALGQIGEPARRGGLTHVIAALRDDASQRVAAQVLPKLGVPTADELPLLLRTLRDRNSPRRSRLYAIESLGGIGQAARGPALADLLELFRGTDAELASAAEQALGKLGMPTPEDIPLLVRTMKDRTAPGRVRVYAITALGSIGGPARSGALTDLVEALRESDAEVRTAADQALLKLGPPTVGEVPKLRRDLRDASVPIRRYAVWALGELGAGDPDLVAAFTEALADPDDPVVRRRAAVSLGKLGAKARDAVPALVRALRDPRNDAEVRMAIVGALAGIGPESGALGGLLHALGDPAAAVSDAAAAALDAKRASLGKADLPVLREALKSGKPRTCILVCKVLAGLKEDAKPAVPELGKLLQDPSNEVRLEAMTALESIGPGAAEAGKDLIGVLKGGDRRTRLRAAQALVRIDPKIEGAGREGVRALVRSLKCESKEDAEDKDAEALRQTARAALVEIGKPAVDTLIRGVEVDFLRAIIPEEDLLRAQARLSVYEIFAEMGPRAYSGDLHNRLTYYLKNEQYPAAQKAVYEALLKIQRKN